MQPLAVVEVVGHGSTPLPAIVLGAYREGVDAGGKAVNVERQREQSVGVCHCAVNASSVVVNPVFILADGVLLRHGCHAQEIVGHG